MKLEIDDIKQRISKVEEDLSDWYEIARECDLMWQLKTGSTMSWKESVELEGREQVVLPTPFNVVNLAQRLIATQPAITIPAKSKTAEDSDIANRIERWLGAAWTMANSLVGRNLLIDLSWQMLVRGCAAMEVKWIQDDLPEKLRKQRFPILIRTLDPMNVVVKRGPFYTEFAAHKYECDYVSARQRFPKAAMLKRDRDATKNESEMVKVIDYWETDPKTGAIWNAVLIDDEFIKKPMKTDYYRIPILEGYGDSAPSINPAHQRIPLLRGINGLWQYQNRLVSQMATGILFFTWPHITVEAPEGHEVLDVEVRPGATDNVPYGTQIKPTLPQFNIQNLQIMIDKIDSDIQNATFPKVMYGDAGAMQAGYGVQQLQSSARNRTQGPREGLEMMIQDANELMLSLVEEFADEDGVELWAKDTKRKVPYTEKLKPSEIDGYYRNLVNLEPPGGMDEVGKQTMLLQMAAQGFLSRQTLHDNTTLIPIPPDENDRIMAEQVEANEEVKPRLELGAFAEKRPETWQDLLTGTQLEQLARDIGIWEDPPPPPPPMPPPGMMMPMPPPGMPPGMPPGPMPPGGQGGAPPGMGGPPPPEMMGPPPGPPPMGAQPDMSMVPPQGGGIPPELQGQITPEMMGMMRDQDPLLFQQAVGNDIPPAELMRMLQERGM